MLRGVISSHSRSIDALFTKTVIQYRIPTFFKYETDLKFLSAVQTKYGTIELVAVSPARNLLPLLQENEFIRNETSQLLSDASRRDIDEREGKEALADLLRSEQGSHQSETQTAKGECYGGECCRKWRCYTSSFWNADEWDWYYSRQLKSMILSMS